MHNLQQLVAEWRKSMAELGVGRRTLDELENHLRETVNQLVRSGTSETEAFRSAVTQLGTPPMIASEFRKLNSSTWLPVKLAMGLGILLAVALAALLAMEFNGRGLTALLKSHVWTVTLGYVGTFLLGGIGICFVCQRCFSDFSQSRLEALKRTSFIFSSLAAMLTAVGIGLAMLWAKAAWGRYWAWDPKETGAFCILAWLIFSTVIHRWRRLSARVVLLLSLIGNVVVGLGWFGANLVGAGLHQHGAKSLLMLAVVVASSLVFFVLGLTPTGWLRLSKG
jgi:hypothetical protein